MNRNPRVFCATWLVGVLMLVAAPAALAIRMTAAFPSDLPEQHVIQPGESTTFAIEFTNLDNFKGVGTAWIRHFLPGYGSNWLIEPIEPDVCLHPVPQEGLRIDFGVELQGGETRRCVYAITRSPTTFTDGYIRLCPGQHPTWYCPSFDRLVFGTLPDIGVTVTPTTPLVVGTTDVTLRIDASNASAVPTRELTLYTQCRQPAAGNPSNFPFRVEVDFPGACPAANFSGCSPEPPISTWFWRVIVPSVAANSTTSCLVRVRAREPFDTTVVDRFGTWSSFPFEPGHSIPLLHAGTPPNPGNGYDMNSTNDRGGFTLYAAGHGSQAVPLGNLWQWSVLALLLAVAGWHRRRHHAVRTFASRTE